MYCSFVEEEKNTFYDQPIIVTNKPIDSLNSLIELCRFNSENKSHWHIIPSNMSSLPLFVLYGSATGNAESIAKDLAAKYVKNVPAPFTEVICCECNAFKKKCLPIWEKQPEVESQKYGVVVVISTTGNGDAPENGSRFVRFIKKKTTSDTLPMRHVAFSVLGLGDTNYDKFCATGLLVDKKLAECGGERVREIAKADEGTGLEEVVEEFIDNIIPLIVNACQKSIPSTNDTEYNSGEMKEDPVEEAQSGFHIAPVLVKTKSTQSANVPPLEVEHDAKRNNISLTSDDSNSSTKYQNLLTLSGVDIAKKLLPTLLNNKSEHVSIPTVDNASLPQQAPTLSSCKCVVGENVESRTSNDFLSSDIEQMTISSSSSSNIHYTLNHPYESTILNARYLTNTPLDGAKEASNILNDLRISGGHTTDENLVSAVQHLQQSFVLKCDKSKGTKNIIERNSKRVIEMTLSLPDDFSFEYEPGDSIGLIASNSPGATLYFLSFLKEKHGLDSTQLISIDGKEPITVETAIRYHVDLCSPIKNKRVLVSLAKHATNDDEKNVLNLLASKDPIGMKLFTTLIDEQRISVADILVLFPSCEAISIDGLLSILPRVPPRYYSVCSSPLANNGNCTSLKVAFSVVDYVTPALSLGENFQRRISGLTTTYLESICSSFLVNAEGKNHDDLNYILSLQIFPKPSEDFRLPTSLSTPMILIGPGTGIAPFVGFLEHRQTQMILKEKSTSAMSEGTWRGGFDIREEGETNDANKNCGDIDLYFGCWYSDFDWLYQEEMKKLQSDKIISNLNVAFSRETKDKKVYVQDKMEENSIRIGEMITKRNAKVYICGDGNSMAKDVQAAIQSALDKYYAAMDDEQLSKEEKVDIGKMKAKNMLLMDIWS